MSIPSPREGDLLISGPHVGAGGLFVLRAHGPEPIDRIATQGLAVANEMLARVVSSGRTATPCAEVFHYDRAGLRRWDRLDGVGNAHDALYLEDRLLLVNTMANSIVAVQDGQIEPYWEGPAYYDAWHINCLTVHDGALVATAFARGSCASGWRAREREGVLVRLPGEQVIVDGLDKPHDPRYIDGMWVLCESGRSRLVAFDDEGSEIRSCLLEGFTRGLAFDKDHIFVGESRLRQRRGESRWSRLVVLDRRTWRTVESIEVPMAEIYALCISPTVFVRAASRGLFGDAFDVLREGPLTRLSSPWCEQWSISERLTSRRAQLDTVIPSRMPARSHHKLRCRFVNLEKLPADTHRPLPGRAVLRMAQRRRYEGSAIDPLRTADRRRTGERVWS